MTVFPSDTIIGLSANPDHQTEVFSEYENIVSRLWTPMLYAELRDQCGMDEIDLMVALIKLRHQGIITASQDVHRRP